MNLQQLAALRDELANDPQSRGYSAMSHAEAADSLNTSDRPAPNKTAVSGSGIFNAIEPDEFAALDAGTQQRVRDVFLLGDSIDVREGTYTRQVVLDAFGVGTTTRTNLGALVQATQTRGEELGLGTVKNTDVYKARNP